MSYGTEYPLWVYVVAGVLAVVSWLALKHFGKFR